MEKPDGSGYFKEVELSPVVTLTREDMIARAEELHHEVGKYCFIAQSVKFPVRHKPVFKIKNA